VTVVQAYREHLIAQPEVVALVAERIYGLVPPQSATLPAVRLQRVDEEEPGHLRGGSQTRPYIMQVDVFTAMASGVDPYAQALTIAKTVNDALLSKRWLTTTGSPADLRVKVTRRRNTIEFFDPAERNEVRVMMEFVGHSKELA
jgi:hypothetical protein